MRIEPTPVNRYVQGEVSARAVVLHFVARSQFFIFEPLPDGWYEFRIKSEADNGLVLDGINIRSAAP